MDINAPTLEELHISLFGAAFQSAHNALADARACAKCYFELRRRGVIFDVQIIDERNVSEDDEEGDEYQASEDQDLFDEIEGLEEHLRDSERMWVDRFYSHFRNTGRISDKQRDILQSILFKLEGRM